MLVALSVSVMAQEVITVEAWGPPAESMMELAPKFEEETGIKVNVKQMETDTLKQKLMGE